MIMADVLTWFLLVVGLLIVFNCYWLSSVALFPQVVSRAREMYTRPFAVTIAGILVAAPVILLGIMIAKNSHPLFKIIGLSTVGLPVFCGLIGSAGLSQRIGTGMASPVDEQQPWRRVLRGGIVLSFLFLLPFLGWFGLLPWTLISGVGAVVLAMRDRRVKPDASIDPKRVVAFAESTEVPN